MSKFTLLDYNVFNGISGKDLETLLPCIGAKMRFYQTDTDLSVLVQDKAHCYLILSGNIVMRTEDGEDYTLEEQDLLNINTEYLQKVQGRNFVSCQAKTDLTLLAMDWEGIMVPCWFSCFFHHRLVENITQASEKQRPAATL